jgi:hypothetical protein
MPNDDAPHECGFELLSRMGGSNEENVDRVSAATGVSAARVWGAGHFYSLGDRKFLFHTTSVSPLRTRKTSGDRRFSSLTPRQHTSLRQPPPEPVPALEALLPLPLHLVEVRVE